MPAAAGHAMEKHPELIDIVDQAGNPLGYSVSREEVHKTGLWHKTVHIWVLNSQNQLLLQKRAMGKETFPGLWDISAAGHIIAGDGSRKTACRELKEEIGIDTSENELVFLFTITGMYKDEKRPFFDHELSDVYLLRKNVMLDTEKMRSDEVDDVRYFDIGELRGELDARPELFVPHHEAYKRLFGYLGTV
jgi:isopentenyl-diphosphate delta-isomerase type 1